MKPKKKRLDDLLLDAGLAHSRRQAEALIISGKVQVDDIVAVKPGHLYPETIELKVKLPSRYVSRGGAQAGRSIKGVQP